MSSFTGNCRWLPTWQRVTCWFFWNPELKNGWQSQGLIESTILDPSSQSGACDLSALSRGNPVTKGSRLSLISTLPLVTDTLKTFFLLSNKDGRILCAFGFILWRKQGVWRPSSFFNPKPGWNVDKGELHRVKMSVVTFLGARHWKY